MKMPKNIVAVTAGIIVGILLLGAVAVLGVGVGRLAISKNQRGKLKDDWRQFYQRNPFPSRENVVKEKENNKTIEFWFSELMTALRKHQIEPEKKSPSMFKGLLDEKRNEMLDLAKRAGVVCPDKFAFGFGRYLASGNLPAPENVPILTQQLLITENLLRLCIESNNVKEIVSIERDDFDAGAAESGTRARGRRGAAVEAPPPVGVVPGVPTARPGEITGDALSGKLHFVFEFKAKESVVWEVLNRLASHGMIVVVTSVQLDNEGADIAKLGGPDAEGAAKRSEAEAETASPKTGAKEKPAAAETAGGGETKFPTREERKVCGLSKSLPMRVKIEMDVYRFKGE